MMIRLVFVSMLLLAGCHSSNTNSTTDGKNVKDDVLTGNLNIAVDESLDALLQEQISVFQESYPHTNISVHKEPEIAAINLLLQDKAQMALLTRELSVEENSYFTNRGIQPRIFQIGYDGIVLVNNINSSDTSIQVSKIIELMKGSNKYDGTLVFEDVNSSTLRLLKEIGRLKAVSSKNVQTADGFVQLLNTILNSNSAIGVMSFDQYLNAKQTFGEIDKIRILSVQNDVGEKRDNLYYKPSQSSLATEEYPLRRPLYILNYQPNTGLGLGFSAFVTGDRGQRILLKSGLLPASMPGRELIIRDNVN